MHRYGLWRSSAIPSLESERGSQTPERAGSTSILGPLTRFSAGPSRSVPGHACPFTEQTKRIQKRARPQPAPTADRAYMLTPDWWESARFQAVCVALSWFRQGGVISSRESAGMVPNPAHQRVTPTVETVE